jgi:hypothetical protein
MSITIGSHIFDVVSYDAGGDVLYLHTRVPDGAVDFDETPEGHAPTARSSVSRSSDHARCLNAMASWRSPSRSARSTSSSPPTRLTWCSSRPELKPSPASPVPSKGTTRANA